MVGAYKEGVAVVSHNYHQDKKEVAKEKTTTQQASKG